MAGSQPDAFDDDRAAALVAALGDVRRVLRDAGDRVGGEVATFDGWAGDARRAFDWAIDTALDAADQVDGDLATSIDDLLDRREQWHRATSRANWPGP